MVNHELTKIPSTRVKWKTWKQRNPNTLVLSIDTGYKRNYDKDPYAGYYRLGTFWFPVGKVRKDLSPKSRILGIELEGHSKAYPLNIIQKNKKILLDSINNIPIVITLNHEGEVLSVTDKNNTAVTHIFSYWFAWQAFHPKTEVYRVNQMR